MFETFTAISTENQKTLFLLLVLLVAGLSLMIVIGLSLVKCYLYLDIKGEVEILFLNKPLVEGRVGVFV